MKTTYRVSHYINAATELVYDDEFTSKTKATAQFHRLVSHFVADRDSCILLSHGWTTIASKSAKDTWVEYHAAFYGK